MYYFFNRKGWEHNPVFYLIHGTPGVDWFQSRYNAEKYLARAKEENISIWQGGSAGQIDPNDVEIIAYEIKKVEG